ncbi:hypothetical protein SteCoe_28965 [Stentor coeruleus]|uniref:non-specific serine/threonine protein kinase n=1 Tax=Stentor coeruleus TaxID=5963 RepID=A0A1R2B7G0_9CILI|nr:hypothetical protein SteCoe_28965 [Stentor coeruleus]
MGCGTIKGLTKSVRVIQTRNTEVSLSPEVFLRVSSTPKFEFYQVLDILGSGAFSEVMLTIYTPTGQKRALKVIRKSPLTIQQLNSEFKIIEMKIIRELDHPNIIKCYEVFEDENNYYMPLEYCENGNLFNKLAEIKRMPESQVAEIIDQILSGVAYFHEKGIIHRDLKPENIMIQGQNNTQIKIGDFGNACYKNPNGLSGVFGTVYYLAPEVLLGYYDEKVDIWSCGIILYVMLTGKSPYKGENVKAIKQCIIDDPFQANPRTFPGRSPLLIDFARKLLDINPKTRYSACQALSHPWLTICRKSNRTSSPLPTIISKKPKNKLVQGTLMYIITCLVKSTTLNDLINTFKAIDINSNGTIEKNELEVELRKTYNAEEAKKITSDVFNDFDLNHNKVIDFTEFLMCYADQKKLFSKPLICGVFEKFDKNSDGLINLQDIEKYLGELPLNEEVNNEVKLFLGSNKKINQEQFVALIEDLLE